MPVAPPCTAQELYKERCAGARSEYITLMHMFSEYLNPEAADACVTPAKLAWAAAQLTFHVDSDYQQDKLTPFWGSSPQPGPTYFYSKDTQYIHIINCHSLGDASGASRLRRNHYYMRGQECAGSKTCNDTVFTFFDFLADRLSPVCKQPQLYRDGYDKHGILPAAAGPAEGEAG